MAWLQKIVSTTLVVVTGCILAILITLFYIVSTLLKVEIDPIVFGSMLAFIASCMGIGYKQFKAKRETQWAEDEETGIAYKPGTRVIDDRFRDVSSSASSSDGNARFNAGINVPKEPPKIEVVAPSTRIKSIKELPPAPAPEEEWEEVEGA
jgi:hypothetical protein